MITRVRPSKGHKVSDRRVRVLHTRPTPVDPPLKEDLGLSPPHVPLLKSKKKKKKKELKQFQEWMSSPGATLEKQGRRDPI